MADRTRELRLVTFITVVRFPLVMLFLAGAIVHSLRPNTALFLASVVCLIVSALTDLFDGALARRFGVQTEFGAHADPLMDKFFYLATLPLLTFVAVHNENLPHAIVLLLMTVTFLTRDQWVTFLRSIGSIYDMSGGAQWAGKVRTAFNFPLIIGIYMAEESPVPFIPTPLLYTCEAFAIFINFYSAYAYTRYYWPSLKRSAAMDDHQEDGV